MRRAQRRNQPWPNPCHPHNTSHRPRRALPQVELFTELIGTMIFALLGGVADPNGTGRDGCVLPPLERRAVVGTGGS